VHEEVLRIPLPYGTVFFLKGFMKLLVREGNVAKMKKIIAPCHYLASG
jgi:hypothetical protein